MKKTTTNTPPIFVLKTGLLADTIEKQLKKQNIEFDPSCIKIYDKLIKGIIDLKNSGFIGKKKAEKLIYKIHRRSIKHVYFIYEML